MLDLQAVVECEPKAVGPVEHRQRDEPEKEEARQRMLHEGQYVFITRRFDPTQRDGQAVKKEQHGNAERRENAAGSEERPPEGLVGFPFMFSHVPSSLLERKNDPRESRRKDAPGSKVCTCNCPARNAFAPYAEDHRFRGQTEPGDTVVQHHYQGNGVQYQCERRLEPGHEIRIGLGPRRQRAYVQQQHDRVKRHEHAGQFPQDEPRVRPLADPPKDRHARAVQLGAVFLVSGIVGHGG